MRVFLLQDRLKAAGGKSAGELRHVHVVGAGVMGGDIAAWCALRGFTVTLQDRSAELIEPALRRARELFDKRLKDPAQNAAALGAPQGRRGRRRRRRCRRRHRGDLRESRGQAGAVREPRAAAEAGALLATNTSSIMLEPLAARLANPARLVGLHFFNPVAQMPLIEVVHARRHRPGSAQHGDRLRAPHRQAAAALPQRPRASSSTAC